MVVDGNERRVGSYRNSPDELHFPDLGLILPNIDISPGVPTGTHVGNRKIVCYCKQIRAKNTVSRTECMSVNMCMSSLSGYARDS